MSKKTALAILLVGFVICSACGNSAAQKPSRNKSEASGAKSEAGSTVDLSSFRGIWISSKKCIEKDLVMEYGGIIIEILKIDGKKVKGTYTAVQEPPANRVASVDFEGTVSDNVLDYVFDDDGFGNKGTLRIVFGNDDIRATVKTEVSDENTSGWSLGNGRFEFRRDGVEIKP